MEYDFITIGRRIVNFRKAKGWSQEKLIEEMEDLGIRIARNTLSAVENGRDKNFTLEILLACCKLFDCDMGYLLGEYGDCKTRDGQFIHTVTGISGTNVERLIAFNTSAKKGTVDAANEFGISSTDSEKASAVIGNIGTTVVNDMIEAFIDKPDIFCGYLEILSASSRLSSEPNNDPLSSLALASSTEISGYEHIPLREYIRFESDRVAKAIGAYLIQKYIGDNEMSDYRRRE